MIFICIFAYSCKMFLNKFKLNTTIISIKAINKPFTNTPIVAKLSKKHNKPCILLSGDIEESVDLSDYFDRTYKCRLPSDSTEEAIKNAKERLITATEKLLKDLKDFI